MNNKPINHGDLWRSLQTKIMEFYESARDNCCTEKDHDNLMRSQAMVATFGTVMGLMQSLEDEARGDPEGDQPADS